MSGQVEVRGIEDLQRFLGTLPERLHANAKNAYRRAVFGAQREITGNLRGSPMQSRTGSLARSILPEVSGSKLSELSGRIYSTSKYAPIHEYGGVVKARDKYLGVPGGPYLNIPQDANKTAAGVMRMGARQVFDQGGYIAGRGVYLDGELMFVLVREVKIEAQLGMRDAADEALAGLIEELRNIVLDDYGSMNE